MEIRRCFEQEAIEESETFLTDDEEVELLDQLNKLVDLQGRGEGNEYDARSAIELAGLAFVAGRTYQHVLDADIDHILQPGDVTIDSFDGILLSKEIVANLIEAQSRVINILMED